MSAVTFDTLKFFERLKASGAVMFRRKQWQKLRLKHFLKPPPIL